MHRIGSQTKNAILHIFANTRWTSTFFSAIGQMYTHNRRDSRRCGYPSEDHVAYKSIDRSGKLQRFISLNLCASCKMTSPFSPCKNFIAQYALLAYTGLIACAKNIFCANIMLERMTEVWCVRELDSAQFFRARVLDFLDTFKLQLKCMQDFALCAWAVFMIAEEAKMYFSYLLVLMRIVAVAYFKKNIEKYIIS